MLLLHCCRELRYDAKFMAFAMPLWCVSFNGFWSCTLLRFLPLYESSIFVLFLITGLGVVILGSCINIEQDAMAKLSHTKYTVISCWKSAYILSFHPHKLGMLYWISITKILRVWNLRSITLWWLAVINISLTFLAVVNLLFCIWFNFNT